MPRSVGACNWMAHAAPAPLNCGRRRCAWHSKHGASEHPQAQLSHPPLQSAFRGDPLAAHPHQSARRGRPAGRRRQAATRAKGTAVRAPARAIVRKRTRPQRRRRCRTHPWLNRRTRLRPWMTRRRHGLTAQLRNRPERHWLASVLLSYGKSTARSMRRSCSLTMPIKDLITCVSTLTVMSAIGCCRNIFGSLPRNLDQAPTAT